VVVDSEGVSIGRIVGYIGSESVIKYRDVRSGTCCPRDPRRAIQSSSEYSQCNTRDRIFGSEKAEKKRNISPTGRGVIHSTSSETSDCKTMACLVMSRTSFRLSISTARY